MGMFGNAKSLEIITVGAIPNGYKSIGVAIGSGHESHVIGFKEKHTDAITLEAIQNLAKYAQSKNAVGVANIKLTSFAATPQSQGPELGVTAIADMIVPE
ncbi:hypothetical protein [Paucilactobacillus sp. N302-9]